MCEAKGVIIFPKNGNILVEGKTKIITSTEDVGKVDINLKDILTAGDGKRKEFLEGIGSLKTTMTCNIFSLLRLNGVNNHFLDNRGVNSFRALRCTMIPLEVVVRRSAPPRSSYLKRHPQIKAGTIFSEPIVELFYKDDAMGDPLVYTGEEGKGSWLLFDPAKPPIEGKEVGSIAPNLSDGEVAAVKGMARSTFEILEKAFAEQGLVLHDFKVEFGKHFRYGGYSIMLADTVTLDEMRLTKDGKVLDKDVFRVGGDPGEILRNYAYVAVATGRFFEDVEE